MRATLIVASLLLAVGLVVALGWTLAEEPTAAVGAPTTQASAEPLRLGLIPERDIFEQRQRYSVLADYLAPRLGRPIELVTARSYAEVLEDFEQQNIDAAFLGSLVSVLAMDQLGAKVLVKPDLGAEGSSYRGVIFVTEDSPVRAVADLAGGSIAVVPTTTAGHLYPIYELWRAGLLDGPSAPRLVWIGTHDEAIRQVLEGSVKAGAVKSHRLSAFERANPQYHLRHIASSAAVPENGLLVRRDVDPAVTARLGELLTAMHEDPEGRKALERFGAERFLPCSAEEYSAVYDMVEQLESVWGKVQVAGPAPKRRGARPSTQPVATPAD